VHRDNYFECLMGDPCYMGEEMFVMHQFGRQELAPCNDLQLVQLYNKMHVGYKVQVEWGIRGFKHKWEKLMKRFAIGINVRLINKEHTKQHILGFVIGLYNYY